VATRLGQPADAVELTHDGERIEARRGEPLALSLLAADRLLLSRSPKLHRPRGPYCLRGACEGCLVRVNGRPNQPACRVLVRGGERVETQNVLGTRETDLLAAADFFFPQGIDHHRLMAGIPGVSPLVGNVARRIAGLGKLADDAPAPQSAERRELPLLIVGGGRRGLIAAAHFGPRATVVDDGATPGGALTALDTALATELTARARAAGASVLERSSVVSLSREPDDGSGRLTALVVSPERTWVLRPSVVLLTTGMHDAVPSFANNDLPGVFSARAALFAWQNDVLLGRRMAIVGTGRYASALVARLSGAVELLVLDPESVVRAVGRERIRAVEVQSGTRTQRIKVEALAFDGPGAPSFELAVQGGGSVDFTPSGYLPRADGRGLVAERLYVDRGDATTDAIERALDGK
jgi:sarcosine oxidase, subunit alpha